jgi:hypothetical protein
MDYLGHFVTVKSPQAQARGYHPALECGEFAICALVTISPKRALVDRDFNSIGSDRSQRSRFQKRRPVPQWFSRACERRVRRSAVRRPGAAQCSALERRLQKTPWRCRNRRSLLKGCRSALPWWWDLRCRLKIKRNLSGVLGAIHRAAHDPVRTDAH